MRGLAGITQEELECELNDLYHHECSHSHLHDLSDSQSDIEDQLTQMVLEVWKAKGMPTKINADVSSYYASKLLAGVHQGYGQDLFSVDYDTPDFKMLSHLKEDVFHFSAAKNYTQLRQLSQALINDKGQLRTFNEFKEVAHGINQDHVDKWLRAEYEQAVTSSQMASTWSKITEDEKELPLLKFDAVNDNRTSPVCKELDGVVRPVNDTFWQIYYPPNHWGCRSDVQQLASGQVTPVEKIITPEKMPAMFKTNLAQNGLVFPPSHPYYIGNPSQVKEQAKALEKQEHIFKPAKTIQEAEAWAKKNLKANIESMKGVSIEVANTLNETLAEIEAAAKNIEPINVSFNGTSAKAYMQYDWKTKTLHLKKNYKNVEQRLSEDNQTWHKRYKDRFSVSQNLSDLIRHEFGHHIDNTTKRKFFKMIDALDLQIKNQAYSISGYASSDRFLSDFAGGSEMMAEQICAKLKNDSIFLKQPKAIQDIINKSIEQ